MPAIDDGLGQPGCFFQRLGGGRERRLDFVVIQQLHDPWRAGFQAIEIIALVGIVAHRFVQGHAQFVDHLGAAVALGDVHFRALFHIDDNGKGDPGIARQVPFRHFGNQSAGYSFLVLTAAPVYSTSLWAFCART